MVCMCVGAMLVFTMPLIAIALGRARRDACREGDAPGSVLDALFFLGVVNVSFGAMWGAFRVPSLLHTEHLLGALVLVNLGAFPVIRRIVEAPPAKIRPPVRPRVESTFE